MEVNQTQEVESPEMDVVQTDVSVKKAAPKKAKAKKADVETPVAETAPEVAPVAEAAPAVEAVAETAPAVETVPDIETITVQPVASEGPVTVEALLVDPNQRTFAQLDLSADILQAVTDMGFTSPSPIQAEAIPAIMSGRDVIGQAQTGTGKTAAFGIPALEIVDVNDRHVQILVLCPTRELAIQVTEEIRKLSKHKRGVRVETIYGGDSIDRQIRSLKTGAHIVVGTPGRVMDHMERNTLKLGQVKMMILDEADEMLDMGFREDIESILEDMPQERQTVLFSATMSKPILGITQRFLKNPILVKVVKKELTNTNIEQVFFEVKPKAKVEVMCRLIDTYDLKLLLVFANTKRKVDEIVEEMQARGYMAEGLHGDLRQAQRNSVMSKFRGGTTSILVATDVAARGIDVDDVDAVINFDIPLDEEYYVHRIGRTGRAGKSGRAFSFVSRDEKYRFREIQNYTKVRVEKGVIPSFEDIVGIRKARFIEQLGETISTSPTDLKLYDDVLTQLHHAGFSTEQVVAALVKQSMGVEKNEFSDQNLGLDEDRRDRQDRGRGDGPDRFNRNDRGKEDRYADRRPSGTDRFGGRNDAPSRDGGSGGSRFGNDRPGSGSRFGNDRDGGRNDGPSRFGGNDRRNDAPRENRDGGSRFGGGDKREGGRSEGGSERQPREREANMTRLFVSIGRRDSVRPGDIVGAIAGEAKISGGAIGSIDIYDNHTFVDVPNDMANKVVEIMDGNSIKGRRVGVEIAR